MKLLLFVMGVATFLAGCNSAKDSEATIRQDMPVVLMSELSSPGEFAHFRHVDSQCSYAGEMTTNGYAMITKMQCPDLSGAPKVQDVQSYVVFGSTYPKAGMSFSLRNGYPPKANRAESGLQVEVANFLISVGRKFESQSL